MISRKPSQVNVPLNELDIESNANDGYSAKAKTSQENNVGINSPVLRVSPPYYGTKTETLRNSPPVSHNLRNSPSYNTKVTTANSTRGEKRNSVMQVKFDKPNGNYSRLTKLFGFITYIFVFFSMTSLSNTNNNNSKMLHTKRNKDKVTILLNTFKRHDLVEGTVTMLL